MHKDDVLRVLVTSPAFWSKTAELVARQLTQGGYSSLNIGMMSLLLESMSEMLSRVVTTRGDIAPEDFEMMEKQVKKYVRDISGDLVKLLSEEER